MSERGDVIVVGGSGSIGTAVVERYLERGIGVVVVDKHPFAGRPPFAASFHHVQADVTCDDGIALAYASAEALALPIHHLVSLAGGAYPTEFAKLVDTDVEIIRRSVELNLTSHVLLTRAFLPLLGFGAADGDDRVDRSITLISSINAVRDFGLPAYSAGKSGMFGFVRAMAGELGAEGIRINVVAPGTVTTSSDSSQPKDREALRRGTVLGRLAEPADIAAAVVAMSHDLQAVTGQCLIVDCGQTVSSPPWRAGASTPAEDSE
jgi:NAD(P)-dependent dehydrogenase (short-subunit alcohol dehydrogenase family)